MADCKRFSDHCSILTFCRPSRTGMWNIRPASVFIRLTASFRYVIEKQTLAIVMASFINNFIFTIFTHFLKTLCVWNPSRAVYFNMILRNFFLCRYYSFMGQGNLHVGWKLFVNGIFLQCNYYSLQCQCMLFLECASVHTCLHVSVYLFIYIYMYI